MSNDTKPSWMSIVTNNGLPRRQDGPWAWLVLGYFFLASLLLGGIAFGYGVILPALMVSLDANREQAALVGSLRLGIIFFACAFTSKICEQFTCRIAGAVGLVMIIVGFVLSSICRSVYPLYLTYSLISGLGASLGYTSGYIALRQYFDKHFSLALGIASAGAGLGTMVIGPLMQALLDSFGWENTFRILSGSCIILLLFITVMGPNVDQKNDIDEKIESRTEISEKESKIQRKVVLGFLDLSLWRFPEYTISVIAIFVSSFGHFTAMIHIVKFSEELSVSNGSTLFVFFGSATVVSRLICGRLCDVSFIKPRYIHQVGAILSGVSTILLSFSKTYTHLIIFAVFYGIADGAFRVTTNILFMNTVDVPRRPSAFGQAYMVTSASLCTGPAIAGLMADKMGSYVGAFIMAGTITILGGFILFVNLRFSRSKGTTRRKVIIPDSYLKNKDWTCVGTVDASIIRDVSKLLSEDELRETVL